MDSSSTGTPGLEAALGRLRTLFDRLDAFVGETCGGFAEMSDQFAAQARLLHAARQRVFQEREAWNSERTATDDAKGRRLAEVEPALADAQRRLSAQAEEHAARLAAAQAQWAQQADDTAAQRHTLQSELEQWQARWQAATAERAELSASAAEVPRLQAELAAAQIGIRVAEEKLTALETMAGDQQQEQNSFAAQCAALTAELNAAKADAARVIEMERGLQAAAHEVAELQSEIQILRRGAPVPPDDSSFRIQQLERERSELESELECVRRRSWEMAEMAAEDRATLECQRAELTGELKRMRSSLEAKSAPAAPRQTGGSPAQPAAHDAVLEDVLAQFQGLQRDLVQRRAAKKSPPGAPGK